MMKFKTDTNQIETLVDFYKTSGIDFKQFNYCNAYVSEVIFNSAYNVNFKLVKSYKTIVGFINLDTEEFFELGKWSRTTSKQVTQIYNQMFRDFDRCFVNLYNI